APSTPVVARSGPAATAAPDASPTDGPATTQADGPGVAVPDEGAGHVEEGSRVEYENSPPASGPHYTRTVEYGVYEQIIPAPYWVHNLEHGAIVLLYRCPDQQESCPDVLRELQSLYERTPPGKYGQAKLVVSQYPDLETSYAVLAWDRMLELDELDEEQVLEFYRAWVDKGPEDVP
ncbi:MAG: DUF3105 domain-containing protein, partial [Chloroflexota bacterium]|nr:DUF3105 domain-containing protein [Chloroflexota bacterium]